MNNGAFKKWADANLAWDEQMGRWIGDDIALSAWQAGIEAMVKTAPTPEPEPAVVYASDFGLELAQKHKDTSVQISVTSVPYAKHCIPLYTQPAPSSELVKATETAYQWLKHLDEIEVTNIELKRFLPTLRDVLDKTK